jgi:ABC-type sugar transport system substrate-binding protein
MADYICKQIGSKGNVAVMMGFAGNTYAEDVYRGVKEGLAQYPDVKEVALVYGAWSPTEGKTAMAGVIAQGEKVDGIINDGGNMGIGITDAYKDAGLPLPPLCGDTGNGWLRVAKENNIKFMGTYPGGNELTLDAVDTAVQVLKGEPVTKNVLPLNTVFNESQLDEMYRPDLNDQYWAMSKLPEEWNKKYYAK